MNQRSPTRADPVTLTATPLRRGLAMACLVALAGALVVQAWGLSGLRQTGFLTLAAGLVVLVWAIWACRHDALVWDSAGLRSTTGRTRVPRAQIRFVDRGLISLRPSQGFTLRLTRPVASGWSVGLYWARGRSIGVGGLTNRGEARAFANRIAADLEAERPSTLVE